MATLKEMIERIDSTRLNAYDMAEKIRWIGFVNLIAHLQGYKLKFEDYEPLSQDDMERELLIKPPYDVAYEYYVYGQMDLNNNEISNYNNDMILYNNAFYEYKKYMIREGYISDQPTFKNIEP